MFVIILFLVLFFLFSDLVPFPDSGNIGSLANAPCPGQRSNAKVVFLFDFYLILIS